ncbi:MAG: BNR-4 repeat-containing protein, partial [Saprospiraceae bacterium]
MLRLSVYSLIFLSIFGVKSNAQTIHVSESGWSRTSANATIFRKNSIVSNDSFQYISFYDDDKKIVIGKRPLISSNWDQKKLSLTGHPEDAHRSISMALDGAGFLHLAWDHHNSDLKYTISQSPGSLDFEPSQSMTKNIESSVTYPEFYRLPNGNLLFLYRDGSSGNGNLIINQFDI